MKGNPKLMSYLSRKNATVKKAIKKPLPPKTLGKGKCCRR